MTGRNSQNKENKVPVIMRSSDPIVPEGSNCVQTDHRR
jgi:hypothetical protein